MKGMVIRMNAKKIGKHTEKKSRHFLRIALRTGVLSIMAASLLLFGVACTDGVEDGTVADSNVGSVTSTPTTGKESERVTEKQTEAKTEANTVATTVPGTTVPGTTVPGTTPGTGTVTSPETGRNDVTTTPGTTTPGTNSDTAPNRGGMVRGKG